MRITTPSPVTTLLASYIGNLSPAHVTRRLNFYEDFNAGALDTDVWVEGGDDGGSSFPKYAGEPTSIRLGTGAVINNDRYIHGHTVKGNRYYTPHEEGYTTVTAKMNVRLVQITDISIFMGLLVTEITDYTSPAIDCAHFKIDTSGTITFKARTYNAAPEETDTGIALDTSFHELKIVWTAADVKFYIDDVLEATHSAQVPDSPLATEFIIRTQAAVAKYLLIDSVSVEVT